MCKAMITIYHIIMQSKAAFYIAPPYITFISHDNCYLKQETHTHTLLCSCTEHTHWKSSACSPCLVFQTHWTAHRENAEGAEHRSIPISLSNAVLLHLYLTHPIYFLFILYFSPFCSSHLTAENHFLAFASCFPVKALICGHGHTRTYFS